MTSTTDTPTLTMHPRRGAPAVYARSLDASAELLLLPVSQNDYGNSFLGCLHALARALTPKRLMALQRIVLVEGGPTGGEYESAMERAVEWLCVAGGLELQLVKFDTVTRSKPTLHVALASTFMRCDTVRAGKRFGAVALPFNPQRFEEARYFKQALAETAMPGVQ